MTTFYLIRHGEKDADDHLIVGRTPGIHLSQRGRKQADAIADRLRRSPIQHVFSSPLERARETAEPLALSRKLTVKVADNFNEYEFGEWTGKSLRELATLPGWSEFNSFRSGGSPPGGEAMLDVQARFVREMMRLNLEHLDAEIAIVSHGDPIRAAICYFLGMPLDLFHRIEISVGSISEITLSNAGAQLIRMNEVPGVQMWR